MFPGRVSISFGSSDLPRAPAPLCDHGHVRMSEQSGVWRNEQEISENRVA